MRDFSVIWLYNLLIHYFLRHARREKATKRITQYCILYRNYNNPETAKNNSLLKKMTDNYGVTHPFEKFLSMPLV